MRIERLLSKYDIKDDLQSEKFYFAVLKKMTEKNLMPEKYMQLVS